MKKLLAFFMLISSPALAQDYVDFSSDFLRTQVYVSERYIEIVDDYQSCDDDDDECLYLKGKMDALYEVILYMRTPD